MCVVAGMLWCLLLFSSFGVVFYCVVASVSCLVFFCCCCVLFFFFNDTAPTEFYPLSLHDALPISWRASPAPPGCEGGTRAAGGRAGESSPGAPPSPRRSPRSRAAASAGAWRARGGGPPRPRRR